MAKRKLTKAQVQERKRELKHQIDCEFLIAFDRGLTETQCVSVLFGLWNEAVKTSIRQRRRRVAEYESASAGRYRAELRHRSSE